MGAATMGVLAAAGEGLAAGASAVGEGIATGASAVGEGLATGASAVGEGLSALPGMAADVASWAGKGIMGVPEMAADVASWSAGKVADAAQWTGGKAADFAQWSQDQIAATPGRVADFAQWTGEGAKDMLSQAWQNVKENNIEPLIARDESGAIDGWKTAGNVAYAIPGGLAAVKGFGGGSNSQPVSVPDMSTPPDTTGGQAQAEDAEMLLNVLRSKTEG